ncbi:MAG: hypothetical protein K0Q55_2949 [Verrucomicrobia bacterium]|jgi:hypothetical protein|nr:hypothetical protein [Verrucomicrobiota bacterium]
MKTLLRLSLSLIAVVCLLAATSVSAQVGSLPGKAKTAAAGISVSFDGSKSTVIYGGQKVFEGPTKAKATAAVKNVNGVQYAAAFDGTRVVWENVKGASAKVK